VGAGRHYRRAIARNTARRHRQRGWRGEAADLMPIALDLSQVPEFHRRIYALARANPPGAPRTYGEIAAALGEPGAARAVGQAMGANPFPIIMPCHRVLAAGGETGGFSAPGGVATKLLLLAIEGAAEARGPLRRLAMM
jgi:methylated-DNA-[protein]-cysteine S-methyltransferase